MGNGVNYIPQKDGNFDTWFQQFSVYLSANYAALGVDLPTANNIAANYATWTAAYSASIGGSTRGPATVSAKNAARAAATVNIRIVAQLVNNNPTVTDDQRVALGITVRKTTKTPVPAPTTSPLLTFIAATPLSHTLRFADQSTPASRALPFGAIALELHVYISATPPPPDAPATRVLTATKNPLGVTFLTANAGLNAYYKGYWRTRTGLLGPASNIINQLIIGAGS